MLLILLSSARGLKAFFSLKSCFNFLRLFPLSTIPFLLRFANTGMLQLGYNLYEKGNFGISIKLARFNKSYEICFRNIQFSNFKVTI